MPAIIHRIPKATLRANRAQLAVKIQRRIGCAAVGKRIEVIDDH